MNGQLPGADEARAARSAWPTGDGEMAARIREMDWAKTPFGPVAGWPVGLKTVVDLMMASRFPMFVAWGPELAFIYNDPYAEILGAKHPRSLGSPFFDIWHEIWDDITPFIDSALAGRSTWIEDLPLTMNRHGQDEATWFTFSYSPMRDDAGGIAGLFCACAETSRQVLASRALQDGEERQAFLLKLSDALRPLADLRKAGDAACRLLVEHLGGSRAQYADVSGDPGEEMGKILGEYAGATEPMPRQFPLVHFGEPVLEILRAGRTLVITDADSDPRLGEDQRRAFRAVGMPSTISVPLVKAGRWIAALTVHDFKPRDWTAEEVELVEEVAERSRAAVERVKAEAARRDSERKAKLLLAELQHRVRNTLAVIRSMVRRTAASSANVDDFERHLDGRLGSFARTQAYVTRDPGGGVDLELIVRDELLAHASNSGRHVSIDGPEVRLTPKQAETMSFAIHELTTNAVKHGALGSDGNRVDVNWSVESGAGERLLKFSWQEKLKDRRLEEPSRLGFGTELLDRVLRYELDAEPVIEFRPEGLSYSVSIPFPPPRTNPLT